MTDEHERPDDAAARARRAWIKVHHPDRGGDPGTFAAGLTGTSWLAGQGSRDAEARVGVYRRGGPGAALRWVVRTCHRARVRARARRRSQHRRVI
ncbi:MAG TPA: hypothetical protein VGH27_29710 [Streptosporangiaceae bacterium]